MRMCAAAILAAGCCCVSSISFAQSNPPAAAAPEPPADATPLPAVTVETSEQPKKASKKTTKAKQKSAPSAAAGAPQQQPAAAPPLARGAPGSGTGPVNGYLAEETTTGTKTDTPLKEVPQSVSVVGRQQMRDQGVQNLQEALRYVPGVYADPYGYDSRGDSAIIRGLQGAYFIDGLRATYGYNSTTTMIEPYALERAEVLRGPGSMLYGQVPTGGLINAVSKLPSEIAYREIGVEYGSFDFKQVKLDATGKLTEDGKWLYRIVGLARDADTQVDFVENDRLMLAPSLTYRPTKDTSITVLGNFRDDHSGSAQQFLPAIGTLTPNDNGRRVSRSTFQGEPEDYYDTDSESASLFVDHRFAPGLELHHASRFSHIDNRYDSHLPIVITPLRESLIGPLIPPTASLPFLDADQTLAPRLRSLQFSETDVFNTDTNLTAKFATGELEHTVLGGVDYMRFSTHVLASDILIDNLDPYAALNPSNPFFGTPQSPWNVYNPQYGKTPYYLTLRPDGSIGGVEPDDITLNDRGTDVQQQTGLYVQDQMKLGRWGAVLGIRQDWLTMDQDGEASRSEKATTGRAALLYNFDFGLTPYVSYSQSFTPLLGARVGEHVFVDQNTQTVVADPLEGEQIEVGFKYQPDGAPFMFSVAAYDLTERNQIVDIDTLVASVQGADVRVRGLEVEAVGKITSEFTAIASYSYTQAEYEKYPGVLPPLAPGLDGIFPAAKVGGRVDGVPEHLASLWGIYTLHDGFFRGLSFGGGVRYVGEAESTGVDMGTYQAFTIKVPSYTLFDAMLAYETAEYRWQLTAQNLEDEYVVTSCGAMRGDCFVGQGRTITTSFFYKF